MALGLLCLACPSVAGSDDLARSEDVFAPARRGLVQCWYPNRQGRTCLAMFSYSFSDDGDIRLRQTMLLAPTAPRIEMSVQREVRLLDRIVCADLTAASVNGASFVIDGIAATEAQTQAIRANVGRTFINTDICWAPADHAPYVWVLPSEGYAITGSIPTAYAEQIDHLRDPLRAARLGWIQCGSPNYSVKTCTSISRFSFGADGVVREERSVVVGYRPLAVMRIATAVTMSGRAICSRWSQEELDAAVFEVGGEVATAEQSAVLRERLRENQFSGGTCVPAPPPVSGDLVTSLIALSASSSAWVRPEEGFVVGE